MDNLQRPEYAHAKTLRRTRYTLVFAALAAAFLAMIILNINTGSVSIPVGRILRILFLRQGEANEVSIIWKIRMPRILQAAILGGALALSGFLLQTFFGNPIAGPFVLGVSSGASGLKPRYSSRMDSSVRSYSVSCSIGTMFVTPLLLSLSAAESRTSAPPPPRRRSGRKSSP